MSRRDLNVGDVLWWVPLTCSGNGRNVTELEVGRTFAQLDNRYRIYLDSWCGDGGEYATPGVCYQSEQEHFEEIECERALHALKECIDETFEATSLSVETIRECAERLGLDEFEDKFKKQMERISRPRP